MRTHAFWPLSATGVVLHQSLTLSWVASAGRYQARAVIKVVNDAGVAVNNVSVTGDFSGAINNANRSDDTNPNGNATITSASTIRNGTVTFTVTAIISATMGCNPVSNAVTSATITR